MKLEDITKMAEADTKIDRARLDEASIDLPVIHNKWLVLLNDEARVLQKLRQTFDVVYKERWEYYAGKAPDEVYAQHPLDVKIMRQDLDIYLHSDPPLMEINEKKQYQEKKIEYIEGVIKVLNGQQWNIRNAIEFIRFTHGVA